MKHLLHTALMLFVAAQLSFGETRRTTPQPATTPIPEGRHVAHPHEVLVNLSNYLLTDYSEATMLFNNGTRITIGGSYFYRIHPYIQIGPRIGLNYVSSGLTSTTVFEFMGAGRVNLPFDWDFDNTFFGGAQFGLVTASGGAVSQTSALLGFEAGKRFALFPNVTWQPHLAILIPTNGALGSVSFQFRFLTASIIF